jgi:hypothetical protein
MPGEGSNDHLHRGEQDLIEDFESEELLDDSLDDLLSPVQNSDIAAIATNVRSSRQQTEQKESEEEEEKEEIQDFASLEFSGDLGEVDDAAAGGGPKRAHRPGDDDETSDEEEPDLPADEPEQADSLSGGHAWSALACAPAPPASSAPAPDPKSWVRAPDSEQE